MGANALGRKKTSDRRFQRIDDFKEEAYRASDLHRENLWSTSIYDVLEKGESYVDTLSIIGLYVVVSNSDV
jgi:hypothetical protein